MLFLNLEKKQIKFLKQNEVYVGIADDTTEREEGTKETKRKIAKKLISKNMKTEEIIELTGLTKEEIEELKNKE